MFELINGIRSIVETCMRVEPEERILVISDNESGPMWVGQLAMNIIGSMGAEVVLTVINPRDILDPEPPAAVAAAMKSVNAVLNITDKAALVHTNARKEATADGVRFYTLSSIPLDDLKQGVTAADIQLIKERTETLAQRLTQANIARLTGPSGTDITMSLTGREGVAIHPVSDLGSLPYYAEAAIPPVEGTAEGVIVVDIAFIDWNCILRKSIRFLVKKGEVTDVSGDKQDADRLRDVFIKYKNAKNIAELGIGTSHIIPLPMLGTRRDAARLGTAHFALGRKDDFGGETHSEVHWDTLMDMVTVELDGKLVLQDGNLQTL